VGLYLHGARSITNVVYTLVTGWLVFIRVAKLSGGVHACEGLTFSFGGCMPVCVHVEVAAIRGETCDIIGYCRLNVTLFADWTEMLSEVAVKCGLPHVLIFACEPVCDGGRYAAFCSAFPLLCRVGRRNAGRDVSDLSQLRHGAVLTLSYYVTDDVTADWRSASASLATEELLYLHSIEEQDKARKDELVRAVNCRT
jgi:hypothetical protein